MLKRQFSRIFGFCKMLSQLNHPWISSVISSKFGVLCPIPPGRFMKSQYFYSTRSTQMAKICFSSTDPISSAIPATRISRITQNEAQNALLDYLHCTRGLPFTDAEHMSKNSPTFLRYLLSKVESEQDVGRALSRYFRYHPINEYEPFFESLGLKPSDFFILLPRKLMFLCDDNLMLENFHILCNYGIPRSKIGNMYKEGMPIFRYECGVLNSKLESYEELGLSKPAIIKLVTCFPSFLIGGVNQDFVGVLVQLKGLEIENDWVVECLSEKNSYHWNRMLDMIVFLNEMGCSKKDFGRLIKKYPGFLFDDSGNKIYVLVALLLKLGIKINEIARLLLQYPRILAGNFTKNLWQAVHFLYEIGMEAEDIAKIVQTHPQVLGSCTLKSPRSVIKKLKMEWDDLCDIIKADPNQLSNLASRSKIKLIRDTREDVMRLLEKTNFLLKLGFVENSEEMMKALKQFRGRGDQLQKKFDCLVDAGLDYHDVSSMIRRAPPMLNQNRDAIEKKIDFLVSCLGYPLQSIVTFPTYLCYDIERVKLRFLMYNWMKKKVVVKAMFALSTILACSEARFVKYLVNRHPEGPQEWERLKKASSSS